MTTIEGQDECKTRRRCRRQLFLPGNEDNVGLEGGKHNNQRTEAGSRLSSKNSPLRLLSILVGVMHKSTKTGIVGIVILICLIAIILAINWQSIKSSVEHKCVNLNGGKTCSLGASNAYRYYGTKTAYHIAAPNGTFDEFQVEGCKPQIFYLLSRHATRYPDEENIRDMIKYLPLIKEMIINSSLLNTSNICDNDIERFKAWNLDLVPANDNKLSDSGEKEAMELAQRFKQRFPKILGKDYKEENFRFEYTSRERTRSTAEAFAEGLFGRERAKSIDFEGKTNDDVLQFHKDCKQMLKHCKSKLDLSELEKFASGPLMKSVVYSISERLGFNVTQYEVEVMYRACSFAYALQSDDVWCSVFSTDELKVLEYEGDLDDYYKDGYGNKINYEQACPVVSYIMNLLNSSMNKPEERAVLHFSHAGAVKKVYPSFGLFHDKEKLTADGLCAQQDRKWKSSLIAPFNSNMAIVLFKCDSDYKITAFHNEQEVTLGGCSDALCPVNDFFSRYTSVAENCQLSKLCCPCCVA